MRQPKGIYLPGSKSPRELITCKGCGQPALVRVGGKGYCTKECANRHRRGAAHPSWRGSDASYTNKHQRVYRARGRPDRCSRCGCTNPAERYEWANLTGDYDDVNDYAPMCVDCHRRYDAHRLPRGSANPNARLTESAVIEIRRRHAAGESAYAMAGEYNVSGNHVSYIAYL